MQTFVEQAFAHTPATRPRFDQQKAQLGHGLVLFDQEHAAEKLTIALGDPAALPMRLQLLDEVGDDMRHQGLEALIPAILAGVEHAVTVHDQAHVAWTMAAQGEADLRRRLRIERGADGMHGPGQAGHIIRVELGDQRAHLVLRAPIELSVDTATLFAQANQAAAAILRRSYPRDQSRTHETRQDPADIPRVKLQLAHQFSRSRLPSLGQLVHYSHLGQGVVAFHQSLVQYADDLGVEAVEGADLGDGSLRCRIRHWATLVAICLPSSTIFFIDSVN